jgi:acetyl-CoA carboxylase biotin carboxyl carrier protein
VTLTAAEVAEIMRLVEQSTFDELTLEIDGMKLTLRRGNGVAPEPTRTSEQVLEAGSATSKESEAVAAGAPRDANLVDVPAPLLGTFYRAPKPGAAPFVEVGSAVDEDTVVAIIEVMKLMNTVRAGVRGVVAEIRAQDGALVEYGEPILRVRKAG